MTMDLSGLVAKDELYPALERITESNRYGLGEIMAAVYRGGHNVRTIHEALLLSRLFQYAWDVIW